nr:c2h2 finger domain transcription factor crza [Quercus suber]
MYGILTSDVVALQRSRQNHLTWSPDGGLAEVTIVQGASSNKHLISSMDEDIFSVTLAASVGRNIGIERVPRASEGRLDLPVGGPSVGHSRPPRSKRELKATHDHLNIYFTACFNSTTTQHSLLSPGSNAGMDVSSHNNYDRRRSPSAGRLDHADLQHRAAASQPLSSFADSNFDPNPLLFDNTALGSYSNPGASLDTAFSSGYQPQAQFPLTSNYTNFQQEQQQRMPPHLTTQNSNFSDHSFVQSNGLSPQDTGHFSSQGSSHVSPSSINNEPSAFPSFDFGSTDLSQVGFDQPGSLDPTLLDGINTSGMDSQVGLLDQMGPALTSRSPPLPHLTPDMNMRRHSGSPSPHTSPGFQQTASFSSQSDNRPRNLSESLDPSSAMFPPSGQGNEWSAMGAYRGAHRRTPSDNYSDISSTHNSPYLGNLDSFDANAQSSPMLNPTSDPSFANDLSMQGFTLNESQGPSQQSLFNYSPVPSPQSSQRLSAQQAAMTNLASDNSYGLNVNVNGQFSQPQNNDGDMFLGTNHEPFPSLNSQQTPGGELGLADQMSPPEINIDFVPDSKNPMEPIRSTHGDDTLSPPQRTGRARSKSDSQASPRPASPGFARGRSPSLQDKQSNSLSPLQNGHNSANSSRSASPARGRNGSLGSRNRSHSASDNRDYILDLANLERSPSNQGRVQKHPATFQCTLCPKRFTRAYNLRSHLRTHTDERPFVCTVCGKAFARQHDRKRHEGLHSGEKKFVCRGTLQSGPQWGCGRRFARADALGRHFRSEAGRVCIKPLLDEEAAERQRVWMQEQQSQLSQQQGMMNAPQAMLSQPQLDPLIGSFLPQALLQQYPALAGLDWNSIPQGPPPEEGDISGRSSYDASSGGEYYDEVSENEMSSYPDPSDMQHMGNLNTSSVMNPQQQPQMSFVTNRGAVGAAYNPDHNHSTSDYLSDFEVNVFVVAQRSFRRSHMSGFLLSLYFGEDEAFGESQRRRGAGQQACGMETMHVTLRGGGNTQEDFFVSQSSRLDRDIYAGAVSSWLAGACVSSPWPVAGEKRRGGIGGAAAAAAASPYTAVSSLVVGWSSSKSREWSCPYTAGDPSEEPDRPEHLNMAQLSTNDLQDLDSLFEFGDIDLNIGNVDPTTFADHMQAPPPQQQQQQAGTHPNSPFNDMSEHPDISDAVAHDFAGHEQFAMSSADQSHHYMSTDANQAATSHPHTTESMFQASMPHQYVSSHPQQYQYQPQQHGFTPNHQVPPTPNSYDMHGETAQFMQQQQQQIDSQQRAMMEQQYHVRKDDAVCIAMS